MDIQSVLVKMLGRLTTCLEHSGHAAFIWIMGKVVGLFGEQVLSLGSAGVELQNAFQSCLERSTATVQQMETAQGAKDMPDGQ